MIRDQHLLAGRVTVRVVDRRGRTAQRIVQENEIVNGGRKLVGQLLVGVTTARISHLGVGTDDSDPELENETLGTEIGTRAEIEAEPLAEPEIGFRIRAQVESGTPQAVSEAGLFNAASDGTLYNRVVFPKPLPVSPDFDLIFEWDVTF